MSGPKQSRFELEAMRKAQLERERKEKIAAIAELELAKTNLAKLTEEMERLGNTAIKTATGNNSADYLCGEIKHVVAEAKKKASKYDFSPKEKKEDIVKQTTEVNAAIKRLQAEDQSLLTKRIDSLTELIRRHEENAKLSAFGESLKNSKKVNGGLLGGIPTRSNIQTPIRNTSAKPKVLAAPPVKESKPPVDSAPLMEKISEFLASGCLGEYRNNALKTIGELEVIDRSDKHSEYSRLNDSFHALLYESDKANKDYMEYKAYCQILKLPPKEIGKFFDTHAILAEKKLLQANYQEANEREYIIAGVNDVMKDLGYNIISSEYVSKRQDNLYEFTNEAGIEVFVSDDGTIMMQVVAMGDNEDLSGRERQNLVNQMANFCERYPDIKNALKAKGIILKQEKMLPANAEFAKKVNIGRSLGKKRRKANGVAYKKMP